MKQQESTVNLVKLCPRCNRQFAAGDLRSCCPDDHSLLAPFANPLLNSVIDERYEIRELLGSGASSEVFLAYNNRLNKVVALKILHLTMVSDPAKVIRFQDEAKAVTKLKHASIAEVHDYGLTSDGRPYMVMDYVEGQSLAESLKSGALEETLACSYIMQLSDALELAHQQGIVHRDIKPANIMFDSTKEARNNCQLLDFGVARTIFDERHSDVTKTGEVLGTPAYMSPEQCMGHAVDGRSDIYSLGCVFYEMLSGERLVQADNQYDCMDWHLSKKHSPYKSSSPQCKDINTVLSRMLAKNSEERYQNTAELKDDLSKILQGLPLQKRVKKTDNRKATALAAAVAALLLLFGVAYIQSIKNHTLQIEAEPADLGALKTMHLWMLLHTEQGSASGAPKIIEANGFGPRNDGRRINAPTESIATAYSPDQDIFYTASPDDLYKINSNYASEEIMRTRGEIILNNLESIAYDSKRKRLLVYGSGPEGHDYLCAYDPNATRSSHKNWNLLLTKKSRSDQWREIRGLAYDAKNDRTYALMEPSDTSTGVVQLAPSGKRLGSILFDRRLPLAFNNNQFFVSNGMAIVFVPKDEHSMDYTEYVFELSSGKLLMSRTMRWDN